MQSNSSDAHISPFEVSEKSTPLSVSPVPDVSPKMKKETQRIKRPMNAFMVWSQIRRQEISSTGGKFHNSDISKMLGAEWRKMAEEEKLPFVQKARELREEHFREHPDYVYRPRRRKRVAKSVADTSINNCAVEETQCGTRLLPAVLLNQLLYQHLLNQLGTGTTNPVLPQTNMPQNFTL